METQQTVETSEPRYPTRWGALTFTEIHERTRKYASFMVFQFRREVDDALQVGYLKLWQRLQAEPQYLVDKGAPWIARFVYFAGLNLQHREVCIQQRSTAYEEDNGDTDDIPVSGLSRTGGHSHESRQADTRIDLLSAITSTAHYILALPAGKEQDRLLWALYGMTMLQIHVTKFSHLFRVSHKASVKAYARVRLLLQQRLEGYAPHQATRPVHCRGQQPLPIQDIAAIRKQNATASDEQFSQVREVLELQQPDTLARDLAALAGIRSGTSCRQQARCYQFSYSSMQRAYERVHLMIAAVVNATVIPRRAEKKHAPRFTFMPEYAALIEQLAGEVLAHPRSQERLVALYAYLCNLPGRTAARQFNMEEAVIRRYRKELHARFTSMADNMRTA